jgi:hypothetical protein
MSGFMSVIAYIMHPIVELCMVQKLECLPLLQLLDECENKLGLWLDYCLATQNGE